MSGTPVAPPASATREEIAQRARDLAPTLAAFSARNEADRRVRPEAVAAIRAAGLFRILLPKRVGGYELDFPAMVDAVSSVAQADAAAGWILLVLTAHDWMMGMFSGQCQDDIYAGAPDALVSGGLAAQGTAEPVEGGWRVSGRWQFGSGVDHGHWSLLGAVQAESRRDDPKHVHVVVPASEYAIDDTWFTLGLRGTGSKDILLEDVFVPEHRSMPTGTLFRGDGPGVGLHSSPIYRAPVLSGLALHVGAASLGIARAGIQHFVDGTTGRVHAYTDAPKAESVGLQLRLAESSEDLHATELLLYDLCRRFDEVSCEERIPSAVRARLMYQSAYAVQGARRAVSRLFDAAGAKAVHDSSPLQQAFRDINTACHHATLDPDDAATAYGRVLLGLRPDTVLL